MKKESTLQHQSEIIADKFGKSASKYESEATIQKKVAQGLVSSLEPWKETLPSGDILEVGCGTGFLSELIAKSFPVRNYIITDSSEEMLSFAKTKFEKNFADLSRFSFEQLNVDQLPFDSEPKYALIVSNFAAQWFSDTALGLEKLTSLLKPNGLLLCAFPGNHSFEEWYKNCIELGLPFTANPLPDVEEIVIKLSIRAVQVDYYENDLYQEFEKSIHFFKHLKDIGASFSKSNKTLSSKQLKILTKHWDSKVNPVKVKWHVIYLAAKKD